MEGEAYERGLEARKRVLGEEHERHAMEAAGEFGRDFQRLLTEYGWGTVWTGTELTDRQRSLNTLCLLAALNRMPEFELHFRAARRNGCTAGELRETLTQIAVYAGIPAGVEAFRIAARVLDEGGRVESG